MAGLHRGGWSIKTRNNIGTGVNDVDSFRGRGEEDGQKRKRIHLYTMLNRRALEHQIQAGISD